MNNRRLLWIILLSGFIFNACDSDPLDVRLPDKDVNIEYVNADKKLYDQPIEEVKTNLKSLSQQLGDLFLFELSNDIQARIYDTSYQMVYKYYTSKYIHDLEKAKLALYNDLPETQQKINKAFSYLGYHFGDSVPPKKIFYVNMLFGPISCSDSEIAIGLENYVSPNDTVIKSIPSSELYKWQRDRMNYDFLERDVLLSWIQMHLFKELDGKLAEHLIQAGKVLYILNAAFPDAKEAYILRYSDDDYNWAVDNERMVWDYLVKQQLLFKRDMKTRANFLNAGPKTVGLPDESPDRLGQFLGYRIVKKFMYRNKTLTLPELINTKYNKILQSYEID